MKDQCSSSSNNWYNTHNTQQCLLYLHIADPPTRVGQEVSPKLDSRGEVVTLSPQVTEHSETPQLQTFSTEGDEMRMMKEGRWKE